MPTYEHMRDAVLTYARCMSEGDIEGILALFTPEAVFEDPVGQEPHIGTAAIRGFFESGYKQVNGEMLMRPEGEVRVAERHAACAMIVDCAKADEPFWIATLDVFVFAEDGLISGMQAYWGKHNFHPLPSPSV